VVNVREVLNAIFYLLSTGCQWQALPKDLPPKCLRASAQAGGVTASDDTQRRPRGHQGNSGCRAAAQAILWENPSYVPGRGA